jgi:hypothetical protein
MVGDNGRGEGSGGVGEGGVFEEGTAARRTTFVRGWLLSKARAGELALLT